MTNRTRSKRTAITWLAVPALLIACADEPAVELDGPHQLPVEFTEEFHIGDQPSERLFVDITSMAFDPDGRLVVLDRDEFAVTMFDVDGTEVARWGNKGEGPGEFENPPSALAVSDDARVAVRSFRRVDVLTLAGELLGSHLLDTLNVREIAFDGGGRVVAWAAAPETRDGRREHIVRLDRPRGTVVGTAAAAEGRLRDRASAPRIRGAGEWPDSGRLERRVRPCHTRCEHRQRDGTHHPRCFTQNAVRELPG